MSTKLLIKVISWLKNVQFFLLPGICIACRKPTGRQVDICPACLATLPTPLRPCQGCGLPLPVSELAGQHCGLCLAGLRAVCFSVMRFGWQSPASGLISQFKYQSKLHYGQVLTHLLVEHIRQTYQQRPLPDLLVPIPLHVRKLRARGFNQSQLIAQQLSRELGILCAPTLLQRIRHTPPQQGLRAAQRRLNLRGAFAVTSAIGELQGEMLTIALVDDVVTTMTTANTVAKLLRKHLPASAQIHLWALARA